MFLTASWLHSTCISTFCLFVGELDLPLGTDIDIVGGAWSVRDVLPPIQHGYRECWRGWFVSLFVMFYLPLSMVIRNVREVGWFVHCFNLTSNSVRFSAIFGLGWFVCEFDLPFGTDIGNVGENGLLVCL